MSQQNSNRQVSSLIIELLNSIAFGFSWNLKTSKYQRKNQKDWVVNFKWKLFTHEISILLRIKNSNPVITSIPNLIIKEFAQIQKTFLRYYMQ